MRITGHYAVILALALLGAAVLVAIGRAAPGDAPLIQGGASAQVAYQGEVRVGGAPYSGDGHFKFAVVNAAGSTTYWSNDGTSTGGGEPTAAVALTVNEGLFSVLLGDTALSGMKEDLAPEVFSEPDRYLRVWFSTTVAGPFSQLAPETRIAAVPYALQSQKAADADTVDGLHASELETHYQNVVIVAKSGGDFTRVQAAIDSITDAAADNPYLVWVAPGVYSETVAMMPYVNLQGAGQEATLITSAVSTSAWPPTQATLVLASDVSLRDLTVGNSGAGDNNAALLATAGVTRTLAADVTARALGGGTNNLAVFLHGSGTSVTLQGVTALAENGSGLNSGLVNFSLSAAALYGGNYTARGGTNAWGIFNSLTVTMKAHNVTALGEHGSNLNKGMYNWNNATVVLYGGDFTGRGGSQTGGTGAANNSTLTAYGATALAENGSGSIGNFAMGAFDNSTVVLSGGVFIARGGVNNYALSNELNVTMKADHVTALAENGSTRNCGLWNVNNATLVLHGASLTGRGGAEAYGIYNADGDTTLEAESVTALGENGSDDNFGLDNRAVATLRGGSFTGRGGPEAWGIYNHGDGTTLQAESVTALAEDGGNSNLGLQNDDLAEAALRGGSFTGRGGTQAYGLHNADSGSKLEADDVSALGENGSTVNFGLYSHGGAATAVHGGSLTGRGGTMARGIMNYGDGSKLEAQGVNALAETGTSSNFGLSNGGAAEAVARGGTFTGRGGTQAYGICSAHSDTSLEAEGVIALGENGSSSNFGLHSYGDATAVRGGTFVGRGGEHAAGILHGGSDTTLDLHGVSALGQKGANWNYGLSAQSEGTTDVTQSVLEGATYSVWGLSGDVTVSNSRLVDGTVSGTVTCVAVSRDNTFNANGCP